MIYVLFSKGGPVVEKLAEVCVTVYKPQLRLGLTGFDLDFYNAETVVCLRSRTSGELITVSDYEQVIKEFFPKEK